MVDDEISHLTNERTWTLIEKQRIKNHWLLIANKASMKTNERLCVTQPTNISNNNRTGRPNL